MIAKGGSWLTEAMALDHRIDDLVATVNRLQRRIAYLERARKGERAAARADTRARAREPRLDQDGQSRPRKGSQ